MELYYDYYQKGCTDLIFILINGKGSATYNNSLMAMDMLIEEHPECEGKIHIYSHDGGSYSAGYGQPAVMAAKMAQEGRSVEEINAYLEESIAPVSYTHLDVYKRQVLQIKRGMGFFIS